MVDPLPRTKHRTFPAEPYVLATPSRSVSSHTHPRGQSHWSVLQVAGLLVACGLIAAGYMGASMVTALFWQGFMLVAPLLFVVAPLAWRNICPLATLNQLPRLLGIAGSRRLPARVHRAAPFVSAGFLLLIVALRPILLDRSAPALATFIYLMLGLAFIGGLLFSGKGGWCTSFCPMLTVERFYGSNPLLLTPHMHCRPCVGCVRNCRDVQPAASIIDLHRGTPESLLQVAVAGAIPWLCVAFFGQPTMAQASPGGMLRHTAVLLLCVALGAALSLIVQQRTRLRPYQLVAFHVVAALQLYYWFSVPLSLRTVGIALPLPIHVSLQLALAALSLYWLRRAWQRERHFQASRASTPAGQIVNSISLSPRPA